MSVKADEIFSEFKEHSVAEFFRKNKQMLGFSGPVRSLTTVVHEYVTNSLDACEEAGILPDITVKITQLGDGHYLVKVADNGPGIPFSHIGKALGMMLAGTKFHRYIQQRGQQGIGAAGCTMFSQLTTGKPTHVKSSTGNGKVYECDVSIDVKTNKPVVSNVVEYEEDFRGVEITAEFADVKYDRSEHSPYEYLKRTAIANPHAEILFIGPDGRKARFPRVVNEIPDRPIEVQPHPLGVEPHELYEMARRSQARKISSFLTSEFARVTPSKVEELKRVLPDFDFDKSPKEMTWDEARKLVKGFKRVKWIAPSAEGLRPIGKDHIEVALRSLLDPEFVSVRTRPPKIYRGGVPFVVEVAISYGGKSGSRGGGAIFRYANRSPLLFDAGGCAITKAVKSIEWKRYEIKDFDNEKITVFVNFVSAFVPYSGAGKQSIAQEPEVIDELRFAIMDVARDLQRYIAGKLREERKRAKKKAIMRYIHQLSVDLPILANTANAEEIEKKLTEIVLARFKEEEREEEKEIKKREIVIEDAPPEPEEDEREEEEEIEE